MEKNQDKPDIFSLTDIVSSTECTGMAPTPPLNDAEADGYADICPVPQQPAKIGKKLRNKRK